MTFFLIDFLVIKALISKKPPKKSTNNSELYKLYKYVTKMFYSAMKLMVYYLTKKRRAKLRERGLLITLHVEYERGFSVSGAHIFVCWTWLSMNSHS